MSGQGGNPWADPATPTQPGAPYTGPPPTAPMPGSPYGPYPPGYPPPYAYPYGHPAPWGPVPPRRPQRPGQVVTAAVLAFVQAVVVLIASVYVWFFASLADLAAGEATGVYSPSAVQALATEGSVLAAVQLLSAVLLIAAGTWALNARTSRVRLLLVAAHAIQVLLAVYWAVRLIAEVGSFGDEGPIVAVALFFAAGPLVGVGMLMAGAGRRWFEGARSG